MILLLLISIFWVLPLGAMLAILGAASRPVPPPTVNPPGAEGILGREAFHSTEPPRLAGRGIIFQNYDHT